MKRYLLGKSLVAFVMAISICCSCERQDASYGGKMGIAMSQDIWNPSGKGETGVFTINSIWNYSLHVTYHSDATDWLSYQKGHNGSFTLTARKYENPPLNAQPRSATVTASIIGFEQYNTTLEVRQDPMPALWIDTSQAVFGDTPQTKAISLEMGELTNDSYRLFLRTNPTCQWSVSIPDTYPWLETTPLTYPNNDVGFDSQTMGFLKLTIYARGDASDTFPAQIRTGHLLLRASHNGITVDSLVRVTQYPVRPTFSFSASEEDDKLPSSLISSRAYVSSAISASGGTYSVAIDANFDWYPGWEGPNIYSTKFLTKVNQHLLRIVVPENKTTSCRELVISIYHPNNICHGQVVIQQENAPINP